MNISLNISLNTRTSPHRVQPPRFPSRYILPMNSLHPSKTKSAHVVAYIQAVRSDHTLYQESHPTNLSPKTSKRLRCSFHSNFLALPRNCSIPSAALNHRPSLHLNTHPWRTQIRRESPCDFRNPSPLRGPNLRHPNLARRLSLNFDSVAVADGIIVLLGGLSGGEEV